MLSEIKNWLSQFKKQYFFYYDGFWRMPYKGNSPHLLIKSFGRLPFVTFDEKRKFISPNAPLLEGAIYYQELEEGCWVFYSRMKYKANICFEHRKDEKLMNTFYCLSLNVIDPKPVICKELNNRPIIFPQYSWSLQTPSEDSVVKYMNLKFAGTTCSHVSVYFDEKWFCRNLEKSNLFAESKLAEFVKSGKGFLFSPFEDARYALNQIKDFETMFGVGDDTFQQGNLFALKLRSLNILSDFFQHCQQFGVVANHYVLHDEEQGGVLKVEKYLVEHLYDKFPGIDFLAKKFGISESKLKVEFKMCFGKPAYQYFQAKQMQLAKELLLEKKTQIKEMAHKFGYENTGKFSAAFKKHHGILPSELQLPMTSFPPPFRNNISTVKLFRL